MIKIGQCPTCRKNEQDVPWDQWAGLADPNCPQCQGSGTIEINKEKRLAFDREIDQMLQEIEKDPSFLDGHRDEHE